MALLRAATHLCFASPGYVRAHRNVGRGRPFDAQVPSRDKGEPPRTMLMLAVQSMLAFPLDTAEARADALETLASLVKAGVSLALGWAQAMIEPPIPDAYSGHLRREPRVTP